MEADTQAHVAFFLTGKRPADFLDAVDGLNLRPALFARYRELPELRYDFPLVLTQSEGGIVQSLSGVVDNALGTVALGNDGERIRKHVLRLEQEIRTLVAQGATGTLSGLWDKAAGSLAAGSDKAVDDASREDSLMNRIGKNFKTVVPQTAEFVKRHYLEASRAAFFLM